MLLVSAVGEEHRRALPSECSKMSLHERLYHLRSDIPAITHVDYSARIHSVSRDANELYWKLISAFRAKTGVGLIVNTSFNVRGEPLVCTPEDAFKCFMRTEMDCVVIGDYLLMKRDQMKWNEAGDWRGEAGLD
jgi:carbamoyltransferase